MKGPEYIVGVDLGQAADFTAISVLHRVPTPTGALRETYRGLNEVVTEAEYSDHFHLRYLERMPLHTPYPSVVAKVEDLLMKAGPGARAIVDATGVGRPVVEMMTHLPIVPVTITAGGQVNQDYFGWKVPKRILVSNAQILLQEHRLTFAGKLPKIDELTKELLAFKVKLSAAGATFESWREGIHDDLVLSICLGAWWGAKTKTGWMPVTNAKKVTDEEQAMIDAAYDRARAANG